MTGRGRTEEPAETAPRRRLARGLATRERLLDAAERLLRDKLFEQISIAEIVRRARATVGSFYNLFAEKDDLLPALYERSCRRTIDQLDELLAPARWRGAALADVVDGVVRALVDLYQRERGTMRALVLRAHCQPALGASERPPGMNDVIPRIAELIGRWAADINHPQPQRAARFGFLAVLATAREQMLYPATSAHAVGLNERELAPELTRLFLGYLRGSA